MNPYFNNRKLRSNYQREIELIWLALYEDLSVALGVKVDTLKYDSKVKEDAKHVLIVNAEERLGIDFPILKKYSLGLASEKDMTFPRTKEPITYCNKAEYDLRMERRAILNQIIRTWPVFQHRKLFLAYLLGSE